MTVIQSAAEVLRAHDDLTVEERDLFLDALIEETARLRACLETVLTGGLGHAAGPLSQAAARERPPPAPAVPTSAW